MPSANDPAVEIDLKVENKEAIESLAKLVDQLEQTTSSAKLFTPAVNKASNALGGLDNASDDARKAVGGLGRESDHTGKELQKLEDYVEGVNRDLKKLPPLGKQARAELDKVGRASHNSAKGARAAGKGANMASAGYVGLAIGLAAVGASLAIGNELFQFTTRSVAEMGRLQSALSEVAAVSGIAQTSLAFKQLEASVRELGATTQFSAQEAAEGMTFLSMAGFNAKEAVDALPSTLALAQAGNLSLAESADITSNILSGFGISASSTNDVVDVLANAASSANTNVRQLGTAMSFAAPVAKQLGVSIEETTAAVSVLSNAGIQGTRAGTNLRMVMLRLVAPSKIASKVLSDAGVNLQSVNPKVVGFTNALKNLQSAGLSTGELSKIFGVEAISGASVLMENLSGSKGLAGLTASFQNSEGKAKQMQETMGDNLPSAIKRASSAFSEFKAKLFLDSSFVDVLKRATDDLATFLLQVSKSKGLAEFAENMTAKLQIAIAGVKNLGEAISFLGKPILEIGSAIKKITPMGKFIDEIARGIQKINNAEVGLGITTENLEFIGEAHAAAEAATSLDELNAVKKDASERNLELNEAYKKLLELSPEQRKAREDEIESLRRAISWNEKLPESLDKIHSARIREIETINRQREAQERLEQQEASAHSARLERTKRQKATMDELKAAFNQMRDGKLTGLEREAKLLSQLNSMFGVRQANGGKDIKTTRDLTNVLVALDKAVNSVSKKGSNRTTLFQGPEDLERVKDLVIAIIKNKKQIESEKDKDKAKDKKQKETGVDPTFGQQVASITTIGGGGGVFSGAANLQEAAVKTADSNEQIRENTAVIANAMGAGGNIPPLGARDTNSSRMVALTTQLVSLTKQVVANTKGRGTGFIGAEIS